VALGIRKDGRREVLAHDLKSIYGADTIDYTTNQLERLMIEEAPEGIC